MEYDETMDNYAAMAKIMKLRGVSYWQSLCRPHLERDAIYTSIKCRCLGRGAVIHLLRLWVTIAFKLFSVEHCPRIGSIVPDT